MDIDPGTQLHDELHEELHEETAAWCRRAEQLPPIAVEEHLALVREGIFLRRRWDRFDRDAAPRRNLLGLLAAAQNTCHQQLGTISAGPDGPDPARVEHMLRRLAEDDHYLAELLADHTSPARSIAFAIECFRDDLHWLGTLVALLDGSTGVDFTGRVLLEQVSLQRSLESFGGGAEPSSNGHSTVDAKLLQSAERLRAIALARQAESLLEQPDPDSADGWFRAWKAASRLAMRLPGATDAKSARAVQAYRERAIA
ncbi:MAG TPA: hypothetical protein VE890_12625, partial [Thermoguttaceae bacterium]|nr:hypothetical protein [Thermoguttaceae bacterium]